MASIVLASVGASVGNMILPGIGGRVLGSLGKKAGQELEEAWGWTSSNGGKRLQNFKIQDSSYGTPIPVLFGCARVAGNVIWASEIIETAHDSSVFGGKGGSYSSSRTTYSYSIHCAVALASGEIGDIQTIWADSKIIYQNGVWASGVIASATFHNGASDQAADPLLESWIGQGLVPAYRGVAYVVLEGFQLSNFGNRLPNLTFEILPKDPTGKPAWLGLCDPNMYHAIAANRNQAMQPIVVDGGSLSARRVIVGGFAIQGLTARFVVSEYDVTGDAPAEVARAQSDFFSGEDPGGHSWAMAADGRFVAMGFQDGATGKPFSVAIYDSLNHIFGPSIAVPMELSEARQIAWLDDYRFIFTGCQGGKRGVHVFMRAGLGVVSLGFFDVWGAGSQTARVPEMYAQFIPCGGGLLHLMANEAPDFSLIEARHLSWDGSTLSLGTKYDLISGANTGTGSGGQAYLFQTSDEEWTLFYGSTEDMRLFSFVPTPAGASLTRPMQILKNASFSLARCHAPVMIGNKIVVLQRSTVENAYRLSEIALLPTSFSLSLDGALLENFSSVGLHFSAVALNATRLMACVNWGTYGDLGRLDVIKRRNTGDTLNNVVARILARSGYASGDYDVDALADVALDGYVLDEQESGASALEPLRQFHPFDLVETNGQLKAVPRGQGGVWTIATDEFEARQDEEEADKNLTVEIRAKETELPVEVRVVYEDATRDYETGQQKARRAVTRGSQNVRKVSLPMVLSPFKAKQIAQETLFAAWSEREKSRFYLSRAWLGIDPGDVIVHEGRRRRVLETRLVGGVLRVDAISCPAIDLTAQTQAESGSSAAANLKGLPASTLYLMDLPMLRPEDDAPGFYAAVSGLAGWPGAGLFRAADGVNFSQMSGFSKAATAGWAVSVLPDRSVHYRDGESVLKIQLLRGELSSCDEAALLGGANAALAGGEVVQFKTAVLVGPGLYELRDLLRGRKGTEGKTGAHVVGESFVLLTSDAIQFLPASLSDRNAIYRFRAVSNGRYLDDAADTAFAYELKTLEPLAPAHLRGARQNNGDVLLTWIRRARKNASWVDYIDVPLDEENERYDVEIVNIATGAVVRTFAEIAQSAQIYSAAQQTEDWGGAAASSFIMRVYQKSARYGRGQKAEETIAV